MSEDSNGSRPWVGWVVGFGTSALLVVLGWILDALGVVPVWSGIKGLFGAIPAPVYWALAFGAVAVVAFIAGGGGNALGGGGSGSRERKRRPRSEPQTTGRSSNAGASYTRYERTTTRRCTASSTNRSLTR